MGAMSEASVDGFLPANYELPKSNSAYMKFEDGDNEFRILASPILGWEYWDKASGGTNKPVRLPYTEENAKKACFMASKNPDPQDQKAKHFWAMTVWNYRTEKIEILQINQRGIQESLRNLAQNKKWGSPVGRYDVVVTKSGVKQDTSYSVAPTPHTDTEEHILQALANTPVDLDALYYGADPFDTEWKAKLGAETFE